MSPRSGEKKCHCDRDEIYNFATGGTLVSIFPQELAISATLYSGPFLADGALNKGARGGPRAGHSFCARCARTVLRGASRGSAAVLVTRLRR